MTATARARLRGYLPPVDSLTALLVVLTVVVQVAAIWLAADPLQAVDAPAPVETAENDPATALPLVVLIFAEVLAFVLVYLAYRRAPAWLRWVARKLFVIGVAGYALLYALVVVPPLFFAYAGMAVAWILGLRWVAYDLGALVVAVLVAATLGGYLGPAPLAVLLVLLMAYDWVGVVETTVMSRLVRVMAELKLPVMVIVPKRLDFDLGAFLAGLEADGIDGDSTEEIAIAVGAGDFALPAALAASAFRFFGPVVAVAVLAGTVVGTLALLGAREQRALPGLPWLGTGALAGLVAGMLA